MRCMQAIKVSRWQDRPSLKIEIRVKQLEAVHTLWNSVLAAWLARNEKSPKEQALKTRLGELARS